MASPTKKIQFKTFNRNYKTFQIFRGFQQISSSISWRVMMAQTVQKSGAGEPRTTLSFLFTLVAGLQS